MATEVVDYRLVIDNENLKAESYFPGIAYDDFDRAGGISPWKICRMFEAGRSVPMRMGNFLDMPDLLTDKHMGFYMLGGDYYFDSCLWEVTRKYHYFPYKVSIQLIHHGDSSLTYRQILINTLDNKEVAEFYGKMVYVDKRQKSSHPLPYWHRVKYRRVDCPERVRLDDTLREVPEGSHKVQTFVAASDTDHNGHTNQASYVRFCLDAAESAGRQGHLQKLTRDICLYPILKMSTAYRGETYVADQIFTYVWEDDLFPYRLHFIIKKGDRIVYSSSITFKNDPCSKL